MIRWDEPCDVCGRSDIALLDTGDRVICVLCYSKENGETVEEEEEDGV